MDARRIQCLKVAVCRSGSAFDFAGSVWNRGCDESVTLFPKLLWVACHTLSTMCSECTLWGEFIQKFTASAFFVAAEARIVPLERWIHNCKLDRDQDLHHPKQLQRFKDVQCNSNLNQVESVRPIWDRQVSELLSASNTGIQIWLDDRGKSKH